MSKPLSPSAMMVLRGLGRGLATCEQIADAANMSKQGVFRYLRALILRGCIIGEVAKHMQPYRYFLTKKGRSMIAPVESEVLP
jgi:predicted transcriptional regulator